MSVDNESMLKLAEAISNLSKSSSSSTKPEVAVLAVTLKLPEFWQEDPEIWFLRVEAQLRSKVITNDQNKFDYVVGGFSRK